MKLWRSKAPTVALCLFAPWSAFVDRIATEVVAEPAFHACVPDVNTALAAHLAAHAAEYVEVV